MDKESIETLKTLIALTENSTRISIDAINQNIHFANKSIKSAMEYLASEGYIEIIYNPGTVQRMRGEIVSIKVKPETEYRLREIELKIKSERNKKFWTDVRNVGEIISAIAAICAILKFVVFRA